MKETLLVKHLLLLAHSYNSIKNTENLPLAASLAYFGM